MKNEIVKFGVILFIITAVAGGLLGFVNDMTEPVIAQHKIEADNEAQESVLNEADKFEKINDEFTSENNPDVKVAQVSKALSGDETVGYIIKTLPKGYGGEIEVTVGIKADGTIEAVKLGAMNETPGLGAKAVNPEFIDQYKDKKADTLKVIKSGTPQDDEILAISGATRTSNGVTKGVNTALEIFKKLK